MLEAAIVVVALNHSETTPSGKPSMLPWEMIQIAGVISECARDLFLVMSSMYLCTTVSNVQAVNMTKCPDCGLQ